MNTFFGYLLPKLCGLRCISSACLVVALAAAAFGQQAVGSLRVRVTDPQGAAVAGATVTVERQGTGEKRTAVTSATGEAVIDNLPPGTYNVKAEHPLLGRAGAVDIPVSLNRSFEVPLTLAPPSMPGIAAPGRQAATRVPDRGEGPQEELSALPNINNDLTPLLQVVPGAVATGPSSLGRVLIDGRGNDQQTARLDGVDFTAQVEFPSADSAVSAVGSFQRPSVAGDLDGASTRSGAFGYEPRHGPGTGSVSEVSTFKGPDSGWKMQLYGDLGNDAFNARNFFDYDGKNALRRSRFGGKFGTALGDMKRTSLFLAYEGWRGRVERNVYEAVPAEVLAGNATGPLAPFMSGFLPAGTVHVPGASLKSDFEVVRRRTRTRAEADAFDIRLDYLPFRPLPREKCPNPAGARECSSFTFRYTHQLAENRVPDGVTGRSQRQRFAFVNGLVGWKRATHAIRPRNENDLKRTPKEFSHNVRFGFNLTRARVNTETPPTTSAELARSLITVGSTVEVRGLPLAPPPPGVAATIPVASLGGQVRGRDLDFKPVSYSGLYDFSRPVAERHAVYAGFEARFLRFDFDRTGSLTYAFSNTAALRTGTPGTVTFLSDLSGPSPFNTGSGPRRARQRYYMGYFQMVSQFAPSKVPTLEPALTLTYGLRYDYFSRVRERDDRAVVVDPQTGELLPPGADFYRLDRANFQPRFGLTYRLGESPALQNTILRAGVGLYSGVPRIADLTMPIENDRFSIGLKSSPFPSRPDDFARAFLDNPLTRLYQPVAFARGFSPLERSLKWDVRLGHMHNGYEFSAYYTGNVGRNLALANFANRITSVTTNPDPTQPAIVTREFGDRFGEFFYRLGGGRSSYNALTFQISRDKDDQKPTPLRWLKIPVASFNAKYTLSRSVGNVTGTIMSDPSDPDADFGDNSGVARHNFTLSAVYNLWQLGENRDPDNFWLGWKISPSLKVTSGLPLIVRLNRPDVVYLDAAGNVYGSQGAGLTALLNTPGGGSSGGAFVPNLIPGASPSFSNSLELLNPAAFAIPAPGQLGNVRRGQFRGPNIAQLDLALRRNLFLAKKEGVQGEFQVEFFNIFNRANFINPTTSLSGTLGTNAAQNQLQPGRPFTRAAAGNFGYVSAADQGRLVQFSFLLRFNEGFTK